MFNLLSDRELKAISNYIADNAGTAYDNLDPDFFHGVKTISNIDHSRTAPLEVVLKPWATSKEWLFNNLFKDTLILSKEVIVDDSETSLREKYYTLLDNFDDFELDMASSIETFFNNNKVFYKIEKGGEYIGFNSERETLIDSSREMLRIFIHTLFTFNNLVSNKLCFRLRAAEIMILTEDNKKIIFSEGMKTIKAIGKAARAFGLTSTFERFRASHSQFLTSKKLRGTLCLSIHPLDYMTMSDNESNWRSCMNWRSGGCYRQGTVEMMNSPYVVVAYLKSENDMPLRCEEENPLMWSNKKWRQLFIVNPAAIVPIKSYPYLNDELTSCCSEWIKELTNITYYDEPLTFDGDWFEEDSCDDSDFVYSEYISPSASVKEENGERSYYSFSMSTGIMYNDFQAVDLVKAYIAKHNEENISIHYSGQCECMNCGKAGDQEAFFSYYDDGDSIDTHRLICKDCSKLFGVCCDCGRRIYNASEIVSYKGKVYCRDCFNHDFIINTLDPKILDMSREEIKERVKDYVQNRCSDSRGFYSEDILFSFKDSLIEKGDTTPVLGVYWENFGSVYGEYLTVPEGTLEALKEEGIQLREYKSTDSWRAPRAKYFVSLTDLFNSRYSNLLRLNDYASGSLGTAFVKCDTFSRALDCISGYFLGEPAKFGL